MATSWIFSISACPGVISQLTDVWRPDIHTCTYTLLCLHTVWHLLESQDIVWRMWQTAPCQWSLPPGIHTLTQSLPLNSTDSILTNRMWRKRCDATSETSLERKLWLPSWVLSVLLVVGEANLHVLGQPWAKEVRQTSNHLSEFGKGLYFPSRCPPPQASQSLLAQEAS